MRVEPYVVRRMEMTVLIEPQERVEVLRLSVFHKYLEFVLYRKVMVHLHLLGLGECISLKDCGVLEHKNVPSQKFVVIQVWYVAWGMDHTDLMVLATSVEVN